jgi:shikimate kinase
MRRVIEPSAEARVVALGGGAILREENRQLIAAAGRCVWLTARPETLARRLAADQATEQRRPALTDLTPADEIRAVLQQREPLYRGSADLIVDTEGKTPPQVAHAILTGVGD